MSSQYDMMDNTAWGKDVKQSMIKKAAEFAKRAHDGVYRKGTQIPYITPSYGNGSHCNGIYR